MASTSDNPESKRYAYEAGKRIVEIEVWDEEENNTDYNIHICNLEEQQIVTLKNTDGDTKIIESVKENIDKFTSKTITLIKGNQGKLYVDNIK